MEKDVIVKSYEGTVRVNCPRSMSQNDVINEVRLFLQSELEKPLFNLSNVEYIIESDPRYIKELEQREIVERYDDVEYFKYLEIN